MRKLLLIVCAVGLTAMRASADGTLIVNSPADSGTGNCFPYGCAYVGEYQQVYASSAFTSGGAITVTKLLFYNTQSNNGATALNSGTWTISLSTTSATPATLSPTFALNIGADNRQVFSGNLGQPWAFGNTLTLTLSTPFTYNPSAGNLLMDVVASGTAAPSGSVYFDVRAGSGTGSVTSRDYCNLVGCATGALNIGYGLVTGFAFGPAAATAVPAASTLSLILIGLGLFAVAYYARQWIAPENRLG
jgi:hypothetical protein